VRSCCVGLLIAAAFGLASSSAAHDSGYAYLRLQVEGGQIQGELELSSRDARFLLGIPAEFTNSVAWAEILERQSQLIRYATGGLNIRNSSGDCPLSLASPPLLRLEERDYALINFVALCPAGGESVSVQYDLLFEHDSSHRALLAISEPGRTQTAVFLNDQRHFELSVRDTTKSHHFVAYLREGLSHIATGFDHLLFLVVLLLPATAVWRNGSWVPRQDSRAVVIEIAKVVSAFTLAHSLTLALAAFGWISLPPRWVEVAIAASVLVAAFNNLQPFIRMSPWILAFSLGLIHGLGFATLLGILGLPLGAKGVALMAFNLGVELGQLLIVAVCLPVLLSLRYTRHYRRAVIELPSLLIAWIAAVWVVERITGYRLLSLD
jgi:hypothetical protein